MTEELSLDGVVRSFNESSEILDQLRERLLALASSDETRQESSNSLKNSADQLAEVTNELQVHTAQLLAFGGKVEDAASLAKTQLSALAPDALLVALGEQKDGLQNVAERMESMESTTSGAIETLAAELAASRARIEQQSADLAAIRSRIAGIPDKIRRKHGLDEGLFASLTR